MGELALDMACKTVSWYCCNVINFPSGLASSERQSTGNRAGALCRESQKIIDLLADDADATHVGGVGLRTYCDSWPIGGKSLEDEILHDHSDLL